VAGAGGSPGAITAGPDGNLWFTQGIGRVARFTLGPETLPLVTKLTPAVGAPGGGTPVTIKGTLLSGAIAVKFGSANAVKFVPVSATSITAVAPAGSGVVDVTVTTPGGTSPSTAATRFSYLPVVKKVTPSSGPEAGGTTVSISGSNLSGATEVSFGSVAATKVTVKSSTSISAVAPPGEEVVDVRVTTPGGTSQTTTGDQFSYTPPPTVTSVSPAAGPKAGGTSVTIDGTGFALGTRATSFLFGTTKSSSVNCVSTTECTVAAPPHAIGTVDVRATVNKLTSAVSAPEDQYTFS